MCNKDKDYEKRCIEKRINRIERIMLAIFPMFIVAVICSFVYENPLDNNSFFQFMVDVSLWFFATMVILQKMNWILKTLKEKANSINCKNTGETIGRTKNS